MVVLGSAIWLLAGFTTPAVLRGGASAPPAPSDVRLTGECVYFDGRQPGGATHFAAGVLVVTADELQIHAGRPEAPALIVLRFGDMQGAALRRYAGERQVQIRAGNGMVVVEMTGRAGQPDTDALMAELRSHRVPFWDSGRFFRKR